MALLLAGSTVFPEESPEFQPLEFLVGEWEASGSGQPGSAVGTTVFRPDLQNRVILRTSFAEYPPADGRPGSRHDDLMVIYGTTDGVKADYYDSEGHVIRYGVRSPAPGEAVFLSEPVAGEPTFRLTYTLASSDSLDGAFEIAAPGAQPEFRTYLSWHSRKVTKPAK